MWQLASSPREELRVAASRFRIAFFAKSFCIFIYKVDGSGSPACNAKVGAPNGRYPYHHHVNVYVLGFTLALLNSIVPENIYPTSLFTFLGQSSYYNTTVKCR